VAAEREARAARRPQISERGPRLTFRRFLCIAFAPSAAPTLAYASPCTGVMLPSVVGTQAAYMMSARLVPGRLSGKRARTNCPVAGSYPASPGTASRWGPRHGRLDPARSYCIPLSDWVTKVRRQPLRLGRVSCGTPCHPATCGAARLRSGVRPPRLRVPAPGAWRPVIPTP